MIASGSAASTEAPVSLITGGAGFVAANLIPRLLNEGRRVVCVDNLSRGRLSYLDKHATSLGFAFVRADLSDRDECVAAFGAASLAGTLDEVWHLAANSDIPAGVADPDVDHKDTFRTTFEVLRAMRLHGVRTLHFASSSAVYGDMGELALVETAGPLLPISNYGAMKLASEAQISAASETHLDRAHLFRFPNVVGVPATHGVIVDFVRKLVEDPERLAVLGNGSQRKAYLHVSDLVDAMLWIRSRASQRRGVFNIGPVDDGVEVRWIAAKVVEAMAPNARIEFGSGNRGWVGDVPRFRYDTRLVGSLGWKPRLDSASAVLRAIAEVVEQERPNANV
jgi:UDP-glucose 4-epimerase